MSDLRERKRRQARERIVDAAFALFAERGFTDVTVTEIAARAEVGRTTFFRYFGDKPEVVFADEQELLEEMTARLATEPTSDVFPALRQLRGSVLALCSAITRAPERYVVHEQLIEHHPELYDRSVGRLQRYSETVEGVLVDQGTPREVAVLATQLALGCFQAGRRLAGSDPTKLVAAVDSAFDQVVTR